MSREERFLFRLKHDRPALAHLAQYFIGHVVGRAHRRDADASCHRLIVHRFAVQIRPIGRDDPGGYCRKTGSCTHHARWNGCRSFGLCPRSLGHCQTEGESAAGLSVYRAGRPSDVVSGWRDSISALGKGPERKARTSCSRCERCHRRVQSDAAIVDLHRGSILLTGRKLAASATWSSNPVAARTCRTAASPATYEPCAGRECSSV